MLTVYLDSQDYSALSEQVLRPELVHVKDELLGMAASADIRFVYSSVVVCEAAPTGSHAVQYAIQRGDFLTALCRRNALLFPSELFEREVGALAKRRPLTRAVVGETQDWFPPVEFEEPTPLADAVRERFNADPMVQAMPRPQRREAERKLFKKGGLRSEVRDAIYLATGQAYVDAIVSRWPMDRAHAHVFRRYALGEASKDEASEAMRASLRDPCQLMRWFSENPELAVPLADIVRKPGQELGKSMRSLVEIADTLKGMEGESEAGEIRWEQLPVSDKEVWEDRVSNQLLGVVRGVSKKCGIKLGESITPTDVAVFCPGIDATVRSMMSSVWDNVGGSRRQLPSDSQFPDAMHAMYAPYVDVFRADSYMAPHIRTQVKRHGTQVVAKLRELPAAISAAQRG